MTAIDTDALPAAVWKNGGGITRTLAVSPPDATLDNFDWRISIADVDSSAAQFSRFPGIDRTIILLDGAGMILQIDGHPHPLTTPFSPLQFAGEAKVRCRMVNGATRDFNVMTRRGRAQAAVNIWQSEFRTAATAEASIYFCARGAFRANSVLLTAAHALIERNHEIQFVPQTADAVMIAVLIKQLET